MEKAKMEGITLISLVITIIVLLILVGVAIAILTGEGGILNKAKTAQSENEEKTATEIIHLKITNAQLQSYQEEEKIPNLQYLADRLCEDNEIQYVYNESKKQANTEKGKITVSGTSIFTKLVHYPYEFEIDASLRLASINGIKLAEKDENKEDQIFLDKINKMEEEINLLKLNTLQYEEKFLWESSTISSGPFLKNYEIEEDGIYYVEVMAMVDSGKNPAFFQTLINKNEEILVGNRDSTDITYPTTSCNSIVSAKIGDTLSGYIYSSKNVGEGDKGIFRVKIVRLK